ncbi:YfnH [Tolypothrix sp. PCC 7601]|nr:YfnH [Tolypothrix sp. PCC 7601]
MQKYGQEWARWQYYSVKGFELKIGFGEKVKGFFFPLNHSPFSLSPTSIGLGC